MNIHHQKHLKPWLVSTTVLVILAGVFVAHTAFARISRNTIDPVGPQAGLKEQEATLDPNALILGFLDFSRCDRFDREKA